MANTKITRAMALAMAIEAVESVEAKEVLERIKTSVERKNSTSATRKPSARQLENEAIKAEIMAFLESHAGEKFSIAELKTEIESIATFNPQRIAPMLKTVQSEMNGKTKVYFV